MSPSQRMTVLDRAPLAPAPVIDPNSTCIMPLAGNDRRAGMGAVAHIQRIACANIDDTMLLSRYDWTGIRSLRRYKTDQGRWQDA